MDWIELKNTVVNWILNKGIKLVVTLVLLFFIFRLANILGRKLEKKLPGNKKLDKTITKAIIHAGVIAIKILGVVAAISILGIDTSSITALIASIGVTAGLAINGALSNFAGGVLILITRPFKVDDYVRIDGQEGFVEDIRIITTKLRTRDNTVIYIPNSTASSTSVINYSEKRNRRVDLTYSISYGSDYKKAEQIILDIAAADKRILPKPEAPFARIVAHGQSSIDIACRVWVAGADYWDVYFDMNEKIKTAFDEAGIEIPFPQLDVHMK